MALGGRWQDSALYTDRRDLGALSPRVLSAKGGPNLRLHVLAEHPGWVENSPADGGGATHSGLTSSTLLPTRAVRCVTERRLDASRRHQSSVQLPSSSHESPLWSRLKLST